MALKFAQKPQTNLSQVSVLEQQYNSGRYYLLIIAIVAVINTAFLFMGADTYYLFSPATPFYMTLMGMLLSNRLPDEYYMEGGMVRHYDVSFADALLIAGVVLTVVVVAAYILFFIRSKKNLNAYIVATVIFGVDTLLLLGYGLWIGMSAIVLDIIYHALVLGLLIYNCVRGYKLNEAKEKEAAAAAEAARIAAQTPAVPAEAEESAE